MKSVALALIIDLMLASAYLRADDSKFLYKDLPDVPVQLSGGQRGTLLKLCRGTPTILTFAYSRCAGICYPFLYSLKDNLPTVKEGAERYRTLVLSFDERETKQNMAEMEAAIEVRDTSTWSFGTVEKAFIRRVTDAVGFEFKYDSATGQIDHPPIVIGINADGKIVRIIRTMDISSQLLWQLYRDIEGDYIPFSRQRKATLVSCFTYDSQKGSIGISWGFLLLYLPAALGALFVWSIFRLRRQRVVRFSNLLLSQQNHLLGRNEAVGAQSVAVHAAGKL